jgi:quinol monooxygenase YgiN
MPVLVQMSVSVEDADRFMAAVEKNRPMMEAGGAKYLMVCRSERDPNLMMMSAVWDSHDQMHESSEKGGDMFNADAGTEGAEWGTEVWDVV